jgi:hypothetical protein
MTARATRTIGHEMISDRRLRTPRQDVGKGRTVESHAVPAMQEEAAARIAELVFAAN